MANHEKASNSPPASTSRQHRKKASSTRTPQRTSKQPLATLKQQQHPQQQQQQQQQQLLQPQQIVPQADFVQLEPVDMSLRSPCRQMAQLELKPKVKQAKLLTSKSLSQLIPRSLFFRNGNRNKNGQPKQFNTTTTTPPSVATLQTTKSFPSEGSSQATMLASSRSVALNVTDDLVNRINSAFLFDSPRQSTNIANEATNIDFNDYLSIGQPNFSPIVLPAHRRASGTVRNPSIVGSQSSCSDTDPSLVAAPGSKADGNSTIEATDDKSNKGDEQAKKKSNRPKYKPFKSTKLALRDVKNSLGLRMKARQDCQAFGKLTNELATPPTKLYSPFNIHTPGVGGSPGGAADLVTTKDAKGRRKLNLRARQMAAAQSSPENWKAPATRAESSPTAVAAAAANDDARTPKNRIALRHKRHLMQETKKFSFESPAGRLRESVKDVEHFQQCIEDISRAIRQRDQPL